MIVSRVMTRNPVFAHPDLSAAEARSIMDREKVGRLPVLDRNNQLVGIVTKKDLLKAGPSPATTLDMYEISYLLSKLKVEKIMVHPVITVDEDEVVEEAARIMADRDINCLPVMRRLPGAADSAAGRASAAANDGRLLVGIITGRDLFRVFINAFGARHEGVRLILSMSEKVGQLAAFAGAVAERGGSIVSIVTNEGDDMTVFRVTCKITGITREAAEEAVSMVPGTVIEDIRG